MIEHTHLGRTTSGPVALTSIYEVKNPVSGDQFIIYAPCPMTRRARSPWRT